MVELNEQGRITLRKLLKREQVLLWFAQHPPCQVSMEACASSHYWGRHIEQLVEQLGHQVKLLPAQHVKAFLQGNKNDYNDALAIAEASQRQRPGIHPVPQRFRAIPS